MISEAQKTVVRDKLASVFEHSITWEDDVWKADPFDIEQVHLPARRKYLGLLKEITDGRRTVHARILLFHGQSGAGKTHLVRALRTETHKAAGLGRSAKGYFGYAQMTPDVGNYADYFLRRIVNSLEKPYDPVERVETGLSRLSRLLVDDPSVVDPEQLEELRENQFEPLELARLIIQMADDVVCSPKFAGEELDINIVRAMLYLQRNDPRIDQRVRTYLFGRQLNDLSQAAVAALDPNEGQDRAFEIIECLGRLVKVVDGASMVFCIDQVEDLRFFEDAEHRFQNAIKDLIQIANRVPSAIVVISCLTDFYEQVRDHLPQSFLDRIEQSGPVRLHETRNSEEARLIVGKRIDMAFASESDVPAPDAADLLGAEFFQDNAGLSTRRLLERVHMRLAEVLGERTEAYDGPKLVPSIAESELDDARSVNDLWERFLAGFEADTPDDEQDQLTILQAVLRLAPAESGGEVQVEQQQIDWLEDLAGLDLTIRHAQGQIFLRRLFICNRTSQGGGLKRQLERVLQSSEGKPSVIIRASNFPDNAKSVTGQLLRRVQSSGTRKLTIQTWEWERMLAMLEFEASHRSIEGFASWVRAAKLLTDLPSISQLLRLDLLASEPAGRAISAPVQTMQPVHARDHATATQSPQSQTSAWPAQVAVGGGHAPETLAASGRSQPANPQSSERSQERTPAATTSKSWIMKMLGGNSASSRASQTAPAGDAAGGFPPAIPGLLPPAPPAGANMAHNAVPSTQRGDASSGLPPDMAVDLGLPGLEQPAAGSNAGGTVVQMPVKPAPVEDENNFSIGQRSKGPASEVMLSRNILRRHVAVLGGSGSGKTTLALTLIEKLLVRKVPVILIDRKGDLCSYASPDVWREIDGEPKERRAMREELGSAIDVAVYTPGRRDGRPINITLLPNGVGELPEQEQMLLASVSAAALGEMLHLGNSSTHQRMSGILSVALRLIGERSTSEVTLDDLIYRLENDDEEIIELTQRMDPTGKARRDLIAQLDSLRHRNAALFDGHGESLRMESLLGLDQNAKHGRTRLSIVYTGFLGDNENVLFWVSQFLSEALRFSQRNPNEDLQAVIMFDEADLYIPANSKPATKDPLESLLKRARSAGIGLILATQSPGDLDYRSRDQITSWFIGRVREDTALKKLRAAFQSESGLDPARVLPGQTVGEFHLIQEGVVQPMKSKRSLINAEQVPFDRIEQLSRETRGQEAKQLRLDLL